MPGDFTYFRKYIIMKNDYTNINNISPRGHAKIEIKGTKGIMRLNVENCQIDEQYRVYLLKEKNGVVEELDLGRVITNEKGRSRTDININARELEANGFPIEKIEAIIIRRDTDILLGGYIDKDNGVIDRYIQDLASEEELQPEELKTEQTEDLPEHFPIGFVADVPEETPEVKDEVNEEVELGESDVQEQEEEYEEEIEEEAEMEFEEEVEDEIESEIEAEVEPEEEVEPEPEIEDITDEEYTEPVQKEPIEEPTYEPNQTYQSFEYTRRLNHKNQMTNYILNVLRYFPQVQPLKIYLHGYTWWRIDDNGSNSYRGFLPYYNYLLSANYKYPFLNNSTTCLNQIKRYGHYLFGIYNEGNEPKFYVYAIPGKFTAEEHPFKGVTGFNTWYDSIDGIGYWILYIDPMTGRVIFPVNPMIPTD